MTQDNSIKKLTLISLSLLSLFLLALVVYFGKLIFFKSSYDNGPYTVTVMATGEAKAIPNVATFNFSAVSEGKDVSEAQNKMNAIANKAIEYLKSQGIEDKDIQTQNYSANPKYEYRSDTSGVMIVPGRQVLVGYEASETVKVKVHDVSKAGTLLSGVGGLGVTEISGISMESDDLDSLKQVATEDAIKKAKDKASKLSQTVGVRLGRIVSFYEENPQGGPIPYGGATDVAMSKSSLVAPQIQPGENTITSTVSITYEIK